MSEIKESDLRALYEKSKENKKAFNNVKQLAVKCQMFELAARLREEEKTLFPETEEVKNAKQEAKRLNIIFRMVDLNIPESACWIILETVKVYNEKGVSFSIDEASALKCKQQNIFSEE